VGGNATRGSRLAKPRLVNVVTFRIQRCSKALSRAHNLIPTNNLIIERT
jgi:hypothetical protein